MHDATILAAAYEVPTGWITVDELKRISPARLARARQELRIPKLRDDELDDVCGVHAYREEPYGEASVRLVRQLLEDNGVHARDVGLLVDYSTVSREANGVSLTYRVQAELGLERVVNMAVNNGSCSSLHLAFIVARGLLSNKRFGTYAVLVSEDHVVGERYNPPLNVLGDGATGVLVSQGTVQGGFAIIDTEFRSDGALRRVMGVRAWQRDNIDLAGFEQYLTPVYYQRMLQTCQGLLNRQGMAIEQVDRVLYQNMSANDSRGLAAALRLSPGTLFDGGIEGNGHILASDLVLNFCLANELGQLARAQVVLLVSSGAGFSWGATLLRRVGAARGGEM